MLWGPIRLLALWLVAAVGMTGMALARAAPSADAPPCHAAAAMGEDYAQLARQPGRWNCAGNGWSIAAPVAFLRFDLRGSADAPTTFATRLTRFETLRLTVIGADGRSASRDLTPAAMTPATDGWRMTAALPRLAGPVATVVVRIEAARHTGLLADARLTGDPQASPGSLRHELLVAALCGMLIMPILLNLAFYRVLRERFLLWHSAAVTFMLAYTLCTSGIVNRFAALDVGALAMLPAIAVAGAMAVAGLLIADIVEPDTLDPRHRRLLRLATPWLALWTLFFLFAGGPLRPLAAPLGMGAFLPVMALYGWVLWVAKARGSRAAIFQIVAWAPVMLPGVIRILSVLGATRAPLDMMMEQHLAMGVEVIVTTLGVIDRLMIIRRQRDIAMTNLRIIEDRADRDPLTGLLNRRVIEKRFAQFYAAGFRAMAVIDLDKFKSVNDTHGHVVGDAVLHAAAEALEPDADTLALRMGGEEFLLLLRGRDAASRAERRRQAIPVRVAARVPGLDRVVTASMGLVEQPPESALRGDFKALYAHCDRLLYEAKHAGRNRTMREKMRGFGGAAGRKARAA